MRPCHRLDMADTGLHAERMGAVGAGGSTTVVRAAVRARAGQRPESILCRQLDRARDVAQARAARNNRLRTIARVRSKELEPRATPAPTRNDVVGLAGKILAEDILVDMGVGEPFYVKWRSSGTSVGRGVDLVFKKADSMSANESNHLHDSIGNAREPISPVVRELDRSFERNTHAHTKDFLANLCLEEEGSAAERDARGDEAGRRQSRERLRAPEKVPRTGAYTTSAAIVFDGVCDPAPAAVLSGASSAATSSLKKPATGFLAGVHGLHDSTAAVIRRHAQ